MEVLLCSVDDQAGAVEPVLVCQSFWVFISIYQIYDVVGCYEKNFGVHCPSLYEAY